MAKKGLAISTSIISIARATTGRINTVLARLVHTEKTARESAILDAVLAVAKESSVSPTEVAIAWLLHKGRKSTTALIPILGSRTPEQLTGTLKALNLFLSASQIARLDETSQISLGTPHGQIKGSAERMAGDTPELLDLPAVPARELR